MRRAEGVSTAESCRNGSTGWAGRIRRIGRAGRGAGLGVLLLAATHCAGCTSLRCHDAPGGIGCPTGSRRARPSRRVRAESYDGERGIPFADAADEGCDASTFAIDVDTASYANVRRILLRERSAPPAGAVRIEEIVNYFTYDDAPPPPDSPNPFAVHVEVGACPWARANRLVRIALRAKEIRRETRPPCNLVFLVDVSGSMRGRNRLPLLKDGLGMLADRLGARDRIAVVSYAEQSRVVLPPTPGDRTGAIRAALRRLAPGGVTNAGDGLARACRLAREHRIPGGANRVVLCTDGDFNAGVTHRRGLVDLVRREAGRAVDLTLLAVGTGNLRDGMMEHIGNRADGVCYYIDSRKEARKVLVEELPRALVTVARDVKAQVFFNPARVRSWRLVGYENRRLARAGFNDDRADGGEMNAGHCAVALYEIVPVGAPRAVDPNPYLPADRPERAGPPEGPLMQVRVRRQPPEGGPSVLREVEVEDRPAPVAETSRAFRWTAAAAGYGLLLRRSPHAGDLDWTMVRRLAESASGPDPSGRRREFLRLVDAAERIVGPRPVAREHGR